jgi:hypothetical protein
MIIKITNIITIMTTYGHAIVKDMRSILLFVSAATPLDGKKAEHIIVLGVILLIR